MNLADFDYDLPESYIAQTPADPRDSSRLMVLDRTTGAVEHLIFRDIVNLIDGGDVLVLNDTRVIPARLRASKAGSGGAVEILLLRQLDELRWEVLLGGRTRAGTALVFEGTDLTAVVEAVHDEAERVVRFSHPINNRLIQLGETPLPPYIHQRLEDSERYQTIYSRHQGSAAAPTAGLHFTPELLLSLKAKGVRIAYCTLHIGLDTFLPMRAEQIEQHRIHSERAVLDAANARIINDARLAGGRIIAVGTTSVRTLETAAILSAGGDPGHPFERPDTCGWRPVIAFEANTNLYIYPGYPWRVVDAMITNFHLPKSSLIIMVSAFAGREHILNAYEVAKRENYRFFSFGDAMFIR